MEIYATNIKELDTLTLNKLVIHLTTEKKSKIKRYKNFEDIKRTVVGELIIRTLVIEKLQKKNSELIFMKNDYGKPELKGAFEQFHYNISHSGDWVVCAIDNKLIGIDIELIKPINLLIAHRFFSKQEYLDLTLKKGDNQQLYFYDLWTLKESYIKADGRGLSIPLNSFTITLINNEFVMTENSEGRYAFFKQYSIDSDYRMGVCSFKNNFPSKVTFWDGLLLCQKFIKLIQNN